MPVRTTGGTWHKLPEPRSAARRARDNARPGRAMAARRLAHGTAVGRLRRHERSRQGRCTTWWTTTRRRAARWSPTRGSCWARAAPRVRHPARAPRRSRPRRPRSPRGSRARARSRGGPGARLPSRRPRRRRAPARTAQATAPLSGQAPGAPVCAIRAALSLHSDVGCPSHRFACGDLRCMFCISRKSWLTRPAHTMSVARLPATSEISGGLAWTLSHAAYVQALAATIVAGCEAERRAGARPNQAQRGRRAGARWRRSGSATPG